MFAKPYLALKFAGRRKGPLPAIFIIVRFNVERSPCVIFRVVALSEGVEYLQPQVYVVKSAIPY